MKYSNVSGFLSLVLLLIFSQPVFAAETIDWQGLVPPVDETLDPYTRLTVEQQGSLYDLWMVRESRKAGLQIYEELEDLEIAATENLTSGGFEPGKILQELDAYLVTLEANNSKLVEDLDGKSVRIPGYVLPTEFSGSKVVEFLLVPYVGACVHTPPPPANQMVHVKVDGGFDSEGLFAPVWVTGQINTAMSTQSVSFNDGALDVEAGYSIEARDVVPYE